MSIRMILISTLLLLFLVVPVQAAVGQEITIYQALRMAEDLEVQDFTCAEKLFDFWIVKGINSHNANPSELLIDTRTGLIESAKNVTPQAIMIGKDTYEFSRTIYPASRDFYQRNQIYKGLEIYGNDFRYFKMKQAIFIKNEEGFVAYFMTKGPGMTK